MQQTKPLPAVTFLKHMKNRLNRYHTEIENLKVNTVQMSPNEIKSLNVS